MSRDKYLSSKEKLPANYLSAADTQRIHAAPSGPANRSVSRDALHLGVRGQRTLCFYNELCQWRLTVPRGGGGNGWLKQHLQVNLGAFACASVCSNEWFTCEITPLPPPPPPPVWPPALLPGGIRLEISRLHAFWQMGLKRPRRSILPIKRSSETLWKTAARFVRRQHVFALCFFSFFRSVPVWAVYLSPTGGRPHPRQELRVRRPPVRGH